MNAEIIKAMNKKSKKDSAFRKWWNKNDYKVMRVIFFPIWWGVCIVEKVKQWLNARTQWSEERAQNILNYYIPRRAEWDEEDRDFYFFDNGYGWSLHFAKKYLKRKDRRFWKKYANGWCGGSIRRYLINTFELEGFTKEILNETGNFTEIIFRLNENNT